MTSLYLSLLISILSQEGMGGEEQHVFLCYEALEKERDPCYGKHVCKMTATGSEKALEQVGEFPGRSCWGVTLAGGTPKHIKVEGDLHGSQGERAEMGPPCLGAGLFGVCQGRC